MHLAVRVMLNRSDAEEIDYYYTYSDRSILRLNWAFCCIRHAVWYMTEYREEYQRIPE